MTFNFHPEAVAEFNAAIDWYEPRSPGLSWDFANEIRATINRAVAMPLAWHILEGDIRRSLVQRLL
jgi:plasmid stabilization system protein ParE